VDNLSKDFLTRLKAGLSKARDLTELPRWVCENTRDPKDESKPFSFDGHEFQEAILSDPSQDLCVKKIAQAGISELSVRSALGMADIFHKSTVIFTLPTSTDASIFSTTRFDTVIKDSPQMREKLDRNVDNTSIKKLGDSFIYIRGTFTKRAAISIPADILFHDEVDFSNQEVLSSYASRLGHVQEDQIIKRRFSTPTVGGYGVSRLFDESTQNWRAVRCDHCMTWQVPKFLNDVVIPGFDERIITFERDDLRNERVKVDEAMLLCPGCRHPISQANLADPAKRVWVSARPDERRAGYQIQPFDLAKINPLARTIRAIDNYKRKADWVNFAIGQEYEDAETSFVTEAVANAHCLKWVEPHAGIADGTVMGVDVGKTSWILIGKPVTSQRMEVLHYERVRAVSENTLKDRVVELAGWYGVKRMVIDAGPDWTVALAVMNALPDGVASASYYTKTRNMTMSFLDYDAEERIVKTDRTPFISDVAKRVNAGKILFCRCPEQDTMKAHLGALKKVVRPSESGDDAEAWVSTDPDHYAHALFFAMIASHLLSYVQTESVIAALPLPARVKVGTQPQRRHYLDRVANG
jgi:hypothetical protein